MLSWSGSQAYDVAAGVNVSSSGVKVLIHATSFESDAADARAALEAAFDKRVAGDRAGYIAALGDIEKKFPTSLAARRAKLERVGTPVVGPVMGVIAGVGGGVAYFFGRGAANAMAGGFGEPGAQPSATKDEKPADEKKDDKPAPDKKDDKKDEKKAEGATQ
jgi:hypothetical protein